MIPPRRFWTKNAPELCACATLAGCKPDCGIINTFNEMEEADAFVDCQTMGDYFRRWLAYLLADRRCRSNTEQDQPHSL